MNKLIKKLMKKFKKGKPNISQYELEVLRGIALYQKEHNGMGCPNDLDVINYYTERARELNFYG